MPNQDKLVVLDELRVHGITVEPKRVRATYTVSRKDGSVDKNELIYSYDKKYFDVHSGIDVNLASVMLVQVALNYGLFCERLVFDGLFDKTDRSFLLQMLENTSREILVNKFGYKNEFLTSEYSEIQIEKRQRYTAAQVEFINTDFNHLTIPESTLKPDRDQYAIPSSGGKDSLLTYGLIRELGTPHPVFINESGRHWFTAVNAFKHYESIEPNTAKPWCNSDRIFNWMLRQLPFIKKNFQNIRSDIYPIRLWTVAVFLFGTLPIALKRGIGNILIGNEYDTTVQDNFHGVSHYRCLYDQSKYFDNAMTRYYARKGWHIYQYSILRSLSELLILKILVKRYPKLQRHQVSCHAAHERDGRMYPCGNCEKCRRIVGMLLALDEDPKRCGYTGDQITRALENLSKAGVKQLGSDAAHLYHILQEKGLVKLGENTRKLAKSHPDIEQLRFDKERSNPQDLPDHIRGPLLKILNLYGKGVVRRVEKRWSDVALSDEYFNTAYLLK